MSYYFRDLIELRKDFTEAFNADNLIEAMQKGADILEVYKKNNIEKTEVYAEDLYNFAVVCDNLHMTDKAKKSYKEAAKIQKDILGEENPDYINTMENLGVLLSREREFAEAEEILNTVKTVTEKNEGIGSEEYVDVLYNIGNMHADSGRFDEALTELSEALECAKAIKDYENEDFIDIRVSIADVCRHSGNLRRARDEYERAIKLSEKCEEPDSYFKMNYFINMALACQQSELYGTAAEIYEQALEIRQRMMDTKHLDYISVLNNLALIYNRDKRPKKALEVHEKVLELIETILGKDHVFYADVITSMGVDYCMMGDYDTAIKYHNDALRMKKEIVSEKHLSYILTYSSLGDVYEKIGNIDKAAEIQNEVLELKRDTLGEVNLHVGGTLVDLGRVYMKKGDNEKAQGFLTQALIMLREVAFSDGIRVNGYGENVRLMAETCANLGEKDKCEQFCNKLLHYRKTIYGDNHPKYAQALYDGAVLMLRLERYDVAEEFLEKACDITETMLGTDTPLCRKCLYERCRALYGLKKFSEVSEVLKKAVSIFKKYGEDENDLIRLLFLSAKVRYMLGFEKKAEEIIYRAEGIAKRNLSVDCLEDEKISYAEVMENSGEHKKAVEIIEGLKDSEDKIKNKFTYFNTAAKAMLALKRNEDALKTAEKAVDSAVTETEKTDAKIIYAQALTVTGSPQKAVGYLREVLQFIGKDSVEFTKRASRIYCMLGEAYKADKDDKKALENYESGIAEAKARENLPVEDYCDYLQNAAEVAKALGEYPKTTEFLSERALIVRRELGETTEFAEVLMEAAEVYILRERYEDAVTMTDRAAEIFREFYGNISEKYLYAVLKCCEALEKSGKNAEVIERLEKEKPFAYHENELNDMLIAAYKANRAYAKLFKARFGKK